MRKANGPLLAALLLCSCAHERASSPSSEAPSNKAPATEVPSSEDGASEAPERAVDDTAGEDAAPGKEPAAAPEGTKPKEPEQKNPVPVEGERQLLALATGSASPGPVSLGAFDVACLASASALSSPDEAAQALSRAAEAQGVSLGQLLLVRIERDPTQSASEPRARVCRPVASDAELYAPLFREKERARRWAVARAGGDLKEDLRRLLKSARAAKGAPADRPYALVVEEQVVLLALPLQGRE